MKLNQFIDAFEEFVTQLTKVVNSSDITKEEVSVLLRIDHHNFNSQKEYVESVVELKKNCSSKDVNRIKVKTSTIVNSLVEKGYLKTQASKDDSRVHEISITKNGENIIEEMKGVKYG